MTLKLDQDVEWTREQQRRVAVVLIQERCENSALREQLCAAQAEIEELHRAFNQPVPSSDWQKMEEQLATQALQIKDYREVFERIAGNREPWHLGELRELLSKPYSDEALRKYVAGYFRKASNAWEHEVKTWCLAVADQIEKGEV